MDVDEGRINYVHYLTALIEVRSRQGADQSAEMFGQLDKQDNISLGYLFGCRTEAKSRRQFLVPIFLLQPATVLIIKTLFLSSKPTFVHSVCHSGKGSHRLNS